MEADFDRDDRPDLVMGNHARNRITVLTQPAGDATGTNWTTALVADVPACKFLATGDLDGDGLPDLVGHRQYSLDRAERAQPASGRAAPARGPPFRHQRHPADQ